MLKELLQPEVQSFIKRQEKEPVDYDRLLFNKFKYPNIPMALVVDQLKAKQKAKYKLPLWFATQGIIMPPLLSMEQSSSEEAATYKAQLFSGKLAIDLTGGAGVDAFYLSKQFERVIYVEMNADLAAIAKHNFALLGANNIKVAVGRSEEFMLDFVEKADLIYIDPARRDENQKLFLLEDCAPNIIELQSTLLDKAKNVLIKASPMLDISLAIKQLPKVYQVQIIAIKNEVKELLFSLNKSKMQSLNVLATDLATKISFKTEWLTKMSVSYSKPLLYLYEPNAAILKSGKMDNLSEGFSIFKLNKHTHLFTSIQPLSDFPGRRFKVINQFKYDKKEIKKHLPNLTANVAVRNFPDTVASIRKKMQIKSGGNDYLFGVRDIDNKPILLLCGKI